MEAGESLHVPQLHSHQGAGVRKAGQVQNGYVGKAHLLQLPTAFQPGQVGGPRLPFQAQVQTPQVGGAESGQVRFGGPVQVHEHGVELRALVEGGEVQHRAVVVEHLQSAALHPGDVVDGAVEELHAVQLLEARQVRQRALHLDQRQQHQVLHIGQEAQIPPIVEGVLVAVLGAVPVGPALLPGEAPVGHVLRAHPGDAPVRQGPVILAEGVEAVPHDDELVDLLQLLQRQVHLLREHGLRRERGGDRRGGQRRRRGLPLLKQDDAAHQEQRHSRQGQDQGQAVPSIAHGRRGDPVRQLLRPVFLAVQAVPGHEGALELLRGRGPVQVHRDHQRPARVQPEEGVRFRAVRRQAFRQEQHQGVPLSGIRAAYGDALLLQGVQDGLHATFVRGGIEGIDGSFHGLSFLWSGVSHSTCSSNPYPSPREAMAWAMLGDSRTFRRFSRFSRQLTSVSCGVQEMDNSSSSGWASTKARNCSLVKPQSSALSRFTGLPAR